MPSRKANPLKVTDTTLRDAHQSLLATRMRTEDMLPMAEKLDEAGFWALEVWGGATFDACLRFLREDPWERLRQLKRRIKKTPLMMLLRGQNLVGYRHYPDDVVDEFVRRAVGNGIDILRIFDALNDLRNVERAMRAAKAEGAHVQGTVVYTESPVHDTEHLLQAARELRELGADSICLKDMAGLLSPLAAADFVRRYKQELDLPLELHSHYTSGMASVTYWTAAQEGVDIVDTCASSMALGTSQPPTESIAVALRGTPRDPGLDLDLLAEVSEHFREVRKKYAAYDVFITVDANVLRYQIPGGMISNFISQLAEQNALDRLSEVLEEVRRVRKDLGYPPLVTPSSQIVGAQAVLNVLLGERYKVVSNEVKAYLKGLYGRPPGPVDEAVRRRVIGDEPVVTTRPADLLPPGLARARREVGPLMEQEEDVLSYALFPPVARAFLEERLAGKTGVDYELAREGAQEKAVYYPA
ncbi:MAG: pyruvate carboxylase subunit B [Thermaerobacter sp.]|nr:pyruvate carboxylase subunit B [Thermaerobacter sp.]